MADLGFLVEPVRLLPAGAEQVYDRVAARDEQLCDQPPVAPPPDRLGAHEARAQPRQLRRERRLPRRGSHARGVAAEGREANAGEALFAKYRRPEDYLAVPQEKLERDVYPTGFFRQKAKSLRGTMKMLVEEFDGEVPRSIDELVRLPGVARKTANVVAAELGNPQGIVVDTHVRRLSQRLGFTKQEDPVKIERDLMKLVPREDWGRFPHLLIWHGRRVCIARRPLCEVCVLTDLCPASRV